MTLTRARSIRLKTLDEWGLESRVGNTPLVRLTRITQNLPPSVQVFAKAEWFNPSGSVKDRPAINIIRSAIADGLLGTGKRLLDSTSGNMGIAYATFGSALGIPVTLCVPANASPERIAMLEALGAEVILTDALEGSDGAMLAARRLAKNRPNDYWYANQYNNLANWQAHYLTTGPEVLEQTHGSITHLVAGIGTAGTLVGAGRFLREQVANIQLVAAQPDEPFHGLEGLKHIPSAIKPEIYDPRLVDRTLEVRTETAYEMVRALARHEGLFAGVSSGAAGPRQFKLPQACAKARLLPSSRTPATNTSATKCFGRANDHIAFA
jgi:cysteine synthase B